MGDYARSVSSACGPCGTCVYCGSSAQGCRGRPYAHWLDEDEQRYTDWLVANNFPLGPPGRAP